MYTYAQPLMQNSMYTNSQLIGMPNPMYTNSQVIGMPNPNSYTNYNTTNIYNNFFGQSNYMAPQTTQMPTIYQGQTIGAYPTVSQMIPQMPMQQPSFGLDQVMGLLMGMMQMMMGGFLGGQDVLEEVIIGDSLAWGDPHFKFQDSTGNEVTIDHKGTDGETYNVLNADGLDIDAEYKQWNASSPQVMGAVRIDAGNQELLLNEGKATLNGEELKAGDYQLNDGRTVTIKDNGSVDISTKAGEGTINIKNNNGYYDVGTSGTVGVNTGIANGGVLGFLATQGQNNSRAEILAEWDKNGNGILDDGDENMSNMFKTNDDIGIYQY